jgi:hypothetical protein
MLGALLCGHGEFDVKKKIRKLLKLPMFRIGKFWSWSLQDPDPSNNKQKIKKTLISIIL